MNEAISLAHAVGRTLAVRGIDTVFGVIGSGNYEATAALRAAGARFLAARHESAAVSMADAYHRTAGKVAAVSVHQGPGLTNSITAIGEAVKSGVPIVVIAGAAAVTARRSNFLIDQEGLAASVGAGFETLSRPDSAVADVVRAHQRALEEMRPVIVNMPIDIQEVQLSFSVADVPATKRPPRMVPADDALDPVVAELQQAKRPVIVAGRGAWLSGAGGSIEELAEILDAPLMTSAMALGMFRDNPRSRGICGGFSTPEGVKTLESSDLILAVGASLTTWTTRGGSIFDANPRIIRIDSSASSVDSGVDGEELLWGDADATVRVLTARLELRGARPNAPSEGAASRTTGLSHDGSVTHVPAADDGPWLDAETATARLDALLPEQRTLVIDGGHFIGWPVQGIRVVDPAGFVFTSAGFQSIGLGMGSAVGAAIARPDRLTVLAVGDGGYQMGISELETMVRLRLPILVVVYNDAAYGAEVHHFGANEPFVDQVRFPVVDVASAAFGAGAEGVTVYALGDLEHVSTWLREPSGPLVLDLRIDPTRVGEWAEQDFLRH